MKKRKLFALTATCLLTGTGLVLSGLTSCGSPEVTDDPAVTNIRISGGNLKISLGQTVTLSLLDQNGRPLTSGVSWSSATPSVATVDESGVVTGLGLGNAIITASFEELSTTTTIMVQEAVNADPASGLRDLYKDDYETNPISGEQNNALLGIQEKYVMEEFLTGIPLVADSSYDMYSDRVELPVEKYQDLMGFGGNAYVTIKNGTSLPGLEANDPYKSYYHLGTSEDPQECFAADSDNSSVDNLVSLMSTPLWTYKFNQDKNGGELYALSAKDLLPTVVDADESGTGKTFRIHVRTESDGWFYTYAGNRQLPGFEKAGTIGNGKTLYKRGVKAEDYLTILRLALTQSNGLYRGAEMARSGYTQALNGAATYYQATANETGLFNEQLWEKVGAKVGTDEGGAYVEFTTVSGFSATSFRDSFQGLPYYSPLPMDVIKTIGVETYGKNSTDRQFSPVDNSVSVGPYTLVDWTTDKQIVFAINSVYTKLPEESEMYHHDGIVYSVYTGAKTDQELLFNEFMAGKLDRVTIPPTKLEQYKTDPKTKEIPDEGTWKINVNACTEEVWEKLFGVNGTVTAHSQENYWEVKPIMSNKNFLSGLYFGSDRVAIAEATGYSPTQNYFSSAYMSYTYNEDGTRIKWNDTPQHQENLKDWYPETYGYNEAAAIEYFKRGLQEEIDKGNYTNNSSNTSSPITIKLTAIWMSQNNITQMGSPFEASVEAVANKAWADMGYRLDIENVVAGVDSDACYDRLKAGEFDLGMGAITGYALDPLGLTQIFCSDNRSGFTLNWGPDTSVTDDRLTWAGEKYSFDGFCTASYGGGIYKDGNAIEPAILEVSDPVTTSDKMVYTLTLRAVEGAGIQSLKIKELEIFDPSTYTDFYYVENGYDADDSNDVDLGEGLEVKLDAEILSSYKTASGAIGIYVSFDVVTSDGTLKDQYFQFTLNGYKA